MNTKPSLDSDSGTPARLICRIAREWCAVAGERNSRHVAACAACQKYFQAGAALENALRLESRELACTLPASDGLERRILQAVRIERLDTAAARQRAPRAVWAIGGIASAAALAVIAVFFKPDSDRFGAGSPNGANGAADAAVIVDAVESFSNRLVDSVIPAAGELVATNPLQKEIGSVYSDMRSALDFLALNFLPSPTSFATPLPTRTI